MQGLACTRQMLRCLANHNSSKLDMANLFVNLMFHVTRKIKHTLTHRWSNILSCLSTFCQYRVTRCRFTAADEETDFCLW